MSQLTGIVFVKIDGELQRSKEGAKLTLGGKARTLQVGHSVYGHTEKIEPSKVEFVITHKGGDDLIGLQNKIDALIEFETDTGDIYICRDMVSIKSAELTGGEGEVAFEYQGKPAELS